MQFQTAQNLQEKWKEKGNPECTHKYQKEYFNATATGDFACVYCGDTISGNTYYNKNKPK